MFWNIFKFKRTGYYNNGFRMVPFKLPTVWTSPIEAFLVEIDTYKRNLIPYKSARIDAMRYLLQIAEHFLLACQSLRMLVVAIIDSMSLFHSSCFIAFVW